MRKFLVAAFILSSVPAHAQKLVPVKTYVITETTLNEIYETLASLPYKQSAGLIAKLTAEAQSQPAPVSNDAQPDKSGSRAEPKKDEPKSEEKNNGRP